MKPFSLIRSKIISWWPYKVKPCKVGAFLSLKAFSFAKCCWPFSWPFSQRNHAFSSKVSKGRERLFSIQPRIEEKKSGLFSFCQHRWNIAREILSQILRKMAPSNAIFWSSFRNCSKHIWNSLGWLKYPLANVHIRTKLSQTRRRTTRSSLRPWSFSAGKKRESFWLMQKNYKIENDSSAIF